jgi:hypothetical protein
VRVPDHPRTLVAKDDTVWIWPGIPLTRQCGDEILPVAAETVHFWITRLHGPGALDKDLLRVVERAAHRLKAGDALGAQHQLDALGLNELSQDGAALMKAIADHIGVGTLDLPVRASMRTWNAQDVALHLPIFKRHVDAARALAKGAIPFDPLKHPRWQAGAPDRQGGQFAPAGQSDAVSSESDAAAIPVALRPKRPARRPPIDDGVGDHQSDTTRGIGDNSGKFPELNIPQDEPPPTERYATVKGIAQVLNEALAVGAILWVQNTLEGMVTIAWLKERTSNYYYQIKADLDPPKTLQELQDAVSHPTLGYQIHHIVELQSGPGEGVSDERLTSRANEVRIPEMTHREISNWYSTPNEDYKMDGVTVSPREYLRGKSWDERYQIGIYALLKFRVLKP